MTDAESNRGLRGAESHCATSNIAEQLFSPTKIGPAFDALAADWSSEPAGAAGVPSSVLYQTIFCVAFSAQF